MFLLSNVLGALSLSLPFLRPPRVFRPRRALQEDVQALQREDQALRGAEPRQRREVQGLVSAFTVLARPRTVLAHVVIMAIGETSGTTRLDRDFRSIGSRGRYRFVPSPQGRISDPAGRPRGC